METFFFIFTHFIGSVESLMLFPMLFYFWSLLISLSHDAFLYKWHNILCLFLILQVQIQIIPVPVYYQSNISIWRKKMNAIFLDLSYNVHCRVSCIIALCKSDIEPFCRWIIIWTFLDHYLFPHFISQFLPSPPWVNS